MRKALGHSINTKLLTIIFVGILLFAVSLTITSIYFINEAFNALYLEKLSLPSRVLLSKYSHSDLDEFVATLTNYEGYTEKSAVYLEDRKFIAEAKENRQSTEFTEYTDTQERMNAFSMEMMELKSNLYRSFTKDMIDLRVSTGCRSLYILTDLGFDDGYVFLYSTFYQVNTDVYLLGDYGTVDMKSLYPEVKQVYSTGESVFIVDKENPNTGEKISYSFTPVPDRRGNIRAVICVEADFAFIGEQLESFLVFSIGFTIAISIAILVMLLLLLKRTIIRPLSELTNISKEIANGNVYVEIPHAILKRKDEMGILGHSYEQMRSALEKLIANSKSLFEDIIIGKLDARSASDQLGGLFARLLDSTNNTLDVIGLYFDSIPASFAILDPENDVVFANKNYKEAFSAIPMVQFYQELLNDEKDDLYALREEFFAQINAGPFNCLRWIELKGEQYCFSFICSGVEQGEKRTGAVIVIMDSTELVLAKDRALLASKAKSEFLSRVSHELRTPLNAILSMAKLGLNDKNLDQSLSRFEKIVTSSAHLSNIINDVLEMSRMESGKTEIKYAPMNVFEIVAECVEMLRIKAGENTNELVSSVDSAIPENLMGDEFRIKQILINLLSNSIKFTENGEISLTVNCIGEIGRSFRLEFSVTDTGIGMSKDFLEKVFVPFEQEDSFMSRRYAGSGLGLSICKNLIDIMGGIMEIESELGKGSRITFTLAADVVPENYTKPETADFPALKDISINGKRILLADDVEINRMIVLELLNEHNVEIDEAVNGREALEQYMASPLHHYDCILMDIQMPVLNGYDATTAIRGSGRKDSSIPIIAMTANALKEDIDHALECGMNDHLSKPLDFNLFIKTISKYFAR